MINNCDPLTIAYIAAGSSIVGGLIGAYINHHFSKDRSKSDTRNTNIDKFIVIITDDIRRMLSERNTTTKRIGDTSSIEDIFLHIKLMIGDGRIDECWEEYHKNEHDRKFQEPEKRKRSIASLKQLIKILNEHKV